LRRNALQAGDGKGQGESGYAGGGRLPFSVYHDATGSVSA